MCAAGTFNANRFGYPLLLLKTGNFLFSGLWLIVNHADNQAYDYPLIRKKYLFLLVLAPFLFADSLLQVRYFTALEPDVITSCCGSLFSAGSSSVAADIAALPAAPMRIVFMALLLATVLLGGIFSLTGRGGWPFSIAAGLLFLAALASVLSFISPAVYELPSHHCPFCILQREYHSIGYLLYILIFGGAVTGMGVGALMPFRAIPSLAAIVPVLQKRYAVLSVLCSAFLGFLVLSILATSNLHQ
jgi:hypothetical protein